MAIQNDAAVDTKLKGVAQLVESAADGEVDSYAGKRHNARITEGVQLEVTEDLRGKPVAVSMHNVSDTGCAFWIKRKLDVHSLLYVRQFTQDNSAAWMPARVTHCTQGIRGFLVGAAFGAQER